MSAKKYELDEQRVFYKDDDGIQRQYWLSPGARKTLSALIGGEKEELEIDEDRYRIRDGKPEMWDGDRWTVPYGTWAQIYLGKYEIITPEPKKRTPAEIRAELERFITSSTDRAKLWAEYDEAVRG